MESFICILNHDRELYYVYLKLVEAQIWVQQRSKGFEPGTSKYKGAGGLGAFAHLRLKNLPCIQLVSSVSMTSSSRQPSNSTAAAPQYRTSPEFERTRMMVPASSVTSRSAHFFRFVNSNTPVVRLLFEAAMLDAFKESTGRWCRLSALVG